MILPFLTFALMQTSSTIGKGSGLYSECKTYIAISEAGSNDTRARLAWMEAGRCIGFVQGTQAMAVGLKLICPAGAKLDTIARVYIAFMDKNPKLRDEQEDVGLMESLVDAYPCRNSQ